MKKISKIIFVVALLALAVGYAYRDQLKEIVFTLLTQDMFVDDGQRRLRPGPGDKLSLPRATGDLSKP